MKKATLLVALFVVGTSGFLIKVPTTPTRPRAGPVGWVHLQKLILPLFENVCEESVDPILVRLAEDFTTNEASGIYLKPDVITNFKNLRAKGLLPKGEIFTDFNNDHINEFKTIYAVFYYAKDFDTFYKAAAWARQNVNCGLFVRAIYLAILNRPDTAKLTVPAPYELLPNYFIQKDVVVKASSLLAGEEVILSDTIRNEGTSYILDANYTADFIDNNFESKLAYFHEDIGLNTYYFLRKLKLTSDMNEGYGEYLYHMMKQLAARYNLERYANGLPDIENIDLDTCEATPYDPMLVYSNGAEFGYRTTSMQVPEGTNKQLLKTIETNVASVVEHLKSTGYNKTQILDHLMVMLVTGERSYESLLRAFVGKDDTFNSSQPSVLDHFLTSLRDPVFWKINKKIVDIVDDALKNLSVYSRNELYFPGVEIINVEVKKITTNFDYFQFDVTEALKPDTTNLAFQVKIGQPRLNHKPFVVKLYIFSRVAQKGLVKIFLGPKVMPGDLFISKKNQFVLLDSFEYNLTIGSNLVSRSSDKMMNMADDFMTFKTIRKQIKDAEFGLDVMPTKNIESILGFPQRLLLPKGNPDGLPLQIYAIVAPFTKSTFSGMFAVPNVEFNSVILSPGYPLDLDIENSQLFDLPNAMLKDVFITQKADKVLNYDGPGETKKSSKGSYDQSGQPEYAALKREPFDYAAKKTQYGRKEEAYNKQEDYAAKREFYKRKSQTNKVDNEIPPQPDVTDDKTVQNLDLEKDNYKDQYNNGIVKIEPVKDSEMGQISYDDKDTSKSLPMIFTRTPSVYDYILNPENYYDEVDVDDTVPVYE